MKFNRSSRTYRLVAGFILPPFFGTFLYLVVAMVQQLIEAPYQYANIATIFMYLPFVFMFAMIFVGIQSLIYSVAMEFIVRPRLLRPKSFLIVSGTLGLLAALPLVYLLSAAFVFFLPIGIVVGVLVGLLIFSKVH